MIAVPRLRVALVLLQSAMLAAALAPGARAAGGDQLIGKPAPDFTRADFGGHEFRLADYRGRVVLVNFFATWCGPCLAEIPRFSALQQAYQAKGIQVIGVAMDDEPAPVAKYLAAHPLKYPVVMGDLDLAKLYGGVLGLPLSYIVDADGRVVARYQGENDAARIEARIKSLLPANPDTPVSPAPPRAPRTPP